MADVEAQFKAALNVIESLPKDGSYKPSPSMMLQFYSLYKQATEGRCNRAKPWSFDVINKAKWDAWNKLGDMSKEEAMKSYVVELTKVMKDFPPPSNEQIIEVLPTTDKAADFVNTLGHFYEIVEPKSDNARKLKSYANSKNMNGNHKESEKNENSPNINLANGDRADKSEEVVGGIKEASVESDDQSSSENDAEDKKKIPESPPVSLPVLPSDNQKQESPNESDDEFCDTSAEITNKFEGRRRDDSESQTMSTLSSSSVNESPSRLNTSGISDKPEDESILFTKQPHRRGGEQGTHGIDETANFTMNKSDLVCPSTSQSINFFPAQTQPLLSSSGGNGDDEDGNSENKRQSEVQERIAVALLQLQRDMHSVLNRLTTLETITISKHQDVQFCRHCCVKEPEKKSTLWPFEELSPKTTCFLLIWPFLARLLISIWTKSKARRRS